MSDRITAQLAFLDEADRLKLVERATPVGAGARRENSGEHSWHLALYAWHWPIMRRPASTSTASCAC